MGHRTGGTRISRIFVRVADESLVSAKVSHKTYIRWRRRCEDDSNTPDVMQELLGFAVSCVLVQKRKSPNAKSARQFTAFQTFSGFHSFILVTESRLCLLRSRGWSYIVWLWPWFYRIYIYFFLSRLIKSLGTGAAPSAASCCTAASGALG